MNDTYWDAEHEYRSRSIGRGTLANAIREAQEQGLSLEDFETIVPYVWRNELEYESPPMLRDYPVRRGMTPNPHVYRFWDYNGDLRYVGKTVSPETRIIDHAKDPRWYEIGIAAVTWEKCDSPEDALRKESFAIATEHPTENIRGKRP